ncbi:MAG: glycosyltransferase family 9 protein [Microcystaceae cyanobacterium]
MRILTLIPGGIGEQILFFPTLATLHQTYPNAIIDVLVEPIAKPAYRICPAINEVLLFNYADKSGLADYLNLLGMIRDREYEIVISASSGWLISFLQWLNGIPTRIAYDDAPKWLITDPITRKPQQYKGQMYHDLLQGLGIQQPCPPLKVALPREDIDWAEGQQQQLGIKDGGYILIYGELNENKGETYYPLPQWQQIIDNLQQKQPDLPIILLQLLEDIPWVAQLKEGYPQLKAIQPSDMGKLAAMIAGANLMIAPQSVPLHLGVGVGTYTIALLGTGEKQLFLPSSLDSYRAIESKTDKIADISPETIIEQIWRG